MWGADELAHLEVGNTCLKEELPFQHKLSLILLQKLFPFWGWWVLEDHGQKPTSLVASTESLSPRGSHAATAFYHISNSCSISWRAVVKSFTWPLHKVCCSRNRALSSSFIFNFTFKACMERHSKRKTNKQAKNPQNFDSEERQYHVRTQCFSSIEAHRNTDVVFSSLDLFIHAGFRNSPFLLQTFLSKPEQ